MIYKHKTTGSRVEAVQFTDPESIQAIIDTHGIHINSQMAEKGFFFFDGGCIERGDYVVSSGFVVLPKTAAWFEARYAPDQEQGELF